MPDIEWDVMEDLLPDQELCEPAEGGNASISNVTCVHETAKALICKIGGTNVTRPIPKSQLRRASEVQKKGDTGTLIVSKWLGKKLDSEDLMAGEMEEVRSVDIPNVVCLSQGRTGKSVVVLLPDGREVMLPTSQILDDSEVRFDGDRGTLKVKPWIAKEKNIP